jgi:hypothetical protein
LENKVIDAFKLVREWFLDRSKLSVNIWFAFAGFPA